MATLIQEDNGNTSTMRVCFLLVVACIMLPYAYVAVVNKALPVLDIGAVGAILGMGVNKWLQKGKESDAVVVTPQS